MPRKPAVERHADAAESEAEKAQRAADAKRAAEERAAEARHRAEEHVVEAEAEAHDARVEAESQAPAIRTLAPPANEPATEYVGSPGDPHPGRPRKDEFPSDWHRQAHIEATKRELEGARLRGAKDQAENAARELGRLGEKVPAEKRS